jgi:hypothetical protein
MRTKLAILTAAALAAGALSSQAQSNVYSLNVVGYVSVGLTNGFNIVANPLDLDGTGTNNTVSGVFGTSLPNNTGIYKFSGGSFSSFYSFNRGVWSPGANTATLNPGESVFIQIPSNSSFTFVGQVLQGGQTNQFIVPGYTLLGSKIPLSGGLQTTLQYTPANGDAVYFFSQAANAGAGGYVPYLFSTRGGWAPSEPQVAPGVGFFLSTTSTSWVQNFTVQ